MSYTPRRHARSACLPLRHLRYHVHRWDEGAQAGPARPLLVMVHGWMDVGASFQFVVDELAELEGPVRAIAAPDWRGFGRTAMPAPVDSYWHFDYVADLDALLDALSPDAPVDLLGHSLGGNVSMIYAGVRPARIRRLVNLEGFGLPASQPSQAPERLVQWLDEVKRPARLRSYESADAVAARLLQNDPLLAPDKAAWLAPHWAAPRDDGRWHLQADPAHKHVNPVLYRREEMVELWKLIEAPVLWIEGDRTEILVRWGARYTRDDFEARIANVRRLRRHVVSPSGHMLHHDQPAAVAALVRDFLDAD